MNNYYYPEANSPNYTKRDEVTAKVVKIMCSKVLPIGAIFHRPIWHKWVYGGLGKKEALRSASKEERAKYGTAYK
jgi:hypothetical protein